MGWVLILMAGLWGLGLVMKSPVRARLIMIAILWAAVVLAHLILPVGSPLRMATGGTAAPWLILAGVVGFVALYARGLGALKSRAQKDQDTEKQKPAGTFSETELDRYARHIILREVGGPGQKKLKQAKVLVIGAGGLGAPALQYLAAAGVGTIGVIDDDVVDNSNLQRQVIHRDDWIGRPKVFSAQSAMEAQNPFVTVRPYNRKFEEGAAAKLVADFDIVLDGTDNFDARYLSNRVAVAAGKPLVSGALSQWEGQLSIFDPAHGTPCYECVFPERPADGLVPTCAEAGVMGPLPGVVGAMMANETIKLITGAGEPLLGEMMIYDALYSETRKLRLKKNPDCPICGNIPAS